MRQVGGANEGRLGATSAPVQPRVKTAAVVGDEQALSGFADRAEAKRLQRILADQEIMLRLSVEGFEGTAWRDVSAALAEYGYAVMDAWVVTGRVFVECRRKGLGGDELTAPRGGIPRAEALELARDTVADALINFRDRVLKQGRWDPAKGASLSTYFVGNCLLRFVNNYRRWLSQHLRLVRAVEYDPDGHDDRTMDPASEVVDRLVGGQRASDLLEGIKDDVNRQIIELSAAGYSPAEIAELTNLDYKKVESRLYRIRDSLRAERGVAGA